MLSDNQKKALVEDLIELSEAQEYKGCDLDYTVQAANAHWDVTQESLRAYPALQKDKTRSADHEALLDQLEMAQLIVVIGTQLLNDIGKSITEKNDNLRTLCNMLDIDYFGDLQHINPNGYNLGDYGFEL